MEYIINEPDDVNTPNTHKYFVIIYYYALSSVLPTVYTGYKQLITKTLTDKNKIILSVLFYYELTYILYR